MCFRVHRYFPKHRCIEDQSVKNIKSTWLAKYYLARFLIDPRHKTKAIRRTVRSELKLTISRQQVHRARKLALKILYGTLEEQYAQLYDYVAEVMLKNPGTTMFVVEEEETCRFEKMYVRLAACKEGFKHCRPIIGLDGCHLKGKYGGVLLTAVSVDPNNNIFPIAWAVVKQEAFETWDWFLSTIETDLDLQDHSNLTFISDKQKGLIKAMGKNFPEADHRFCVRHLHGNMKSAGHTGNHSYSTLFT